MVDSPSYSLSCLSITQKSGGRNERCQTFCLFPSMQCSEWWCWKSRQGQDALEKKAGAWPGKRIGTKKKVTSKLEQGLNITVNAIATMISVKETWRQQAWFFDVFYDLNNRHFCPWLNSKGIILQKLLTFLRLYWISQSEGLSTPCSQLTVKAMFERLRKLQCFKAV